MTSDKYQHLIIDGLEQGTAIISGETMLNGQVQWDSSPQSNEFDLDVNDPRFKACLITAHNLKTKYPLDGLDPATSRTEIIARERAIVAALTEKIHGEYGDYNPDVSKAVEADDQNLNKLPSLHDDVAREHENPPAKLSEFAKGQLTCRHYAPLASALCTEAGIPNVMIYGGQEFSYYMQNDVAVELGKPNEHFSHAYDVSRLTGSVIDATTLGDYAYRQQLGATSIEDIMAGKPILSATSENVYFVYSNGYTGSPEQEQLIDTRKEKISRGDWAMPPPVAKLDPAKSAEAFAAAIDYAQKDVAAYYQHSVKPSLATLQEAIAKGDVDAARESLEKFPYSADFMIQGLSNALAMQNTPLINVLSDKIDIANSKNKANILFDAHPAAPLDQDCISNFLAKANISPEDYFKAAVYHGNNAHINLALDILDEKPTSPEIMAILDDASADLRSRRLAQTDEMAKNILSFRELKYGKQPEIALRPKVERPRKVIDTVRELAEQQRDAIAALGPPQPHESSGMGGTLLAAGIGAAVAGGAGLAFGSGVLGTLAWILGGLVVGGAIGAYIESDKPKHILQPSTPLTKGKDVETPEPKKDLAKLSALPAPKTEPAMVINAEALTRAQSVVSAMDKNPKDMHKPEEHFSANPNHTLPFSKPITAKVV
jgi:hypothetical protein